MFVYNVKMFSKKKFLKISIHFEKMNVASVDNLYMSNSSNFHPERRNKNLKNEKFYLSNRTQNAVNSVKLTRNWFPTVSNTCILAEQYGTLFLSRVFKHSCRPCTKEQTTYTTNQMYFRERKKTRHKTVTLPDYLHLCNWAQYVLFKLLDLVSKKTIVFDTFADRLVATTNAY